MSELVHLIEWGGVGSFIVILALIWACERVITAFINRNKPAPQECCHDDEEEDDECEDEDEEVVAMGGQVDEHSHEDDEESPPTTRSRQ